MFSTRRLVGTLLALVLSAAAQTMAGAPDQQQSFSNRKWTQLSSRQKKATASSRFSDGNNRAQPRRGRKTALPEANSAPIFLTAPAYDSGGQLPTSIAAGDFNGDGKLDLAVVNSSSNNIGILISNGDGTFQPAATYPTAANPAYVIAADLNGDGIPDLAVGAGTVIDVFLANGDGTFRAVASYNSGGFDVGSLAFGDFNHDGKIDLVVPQGCADSNCTNGSVTVLFGNGDGTFQAPRSLSSGQAVAVSVAVGDFNNDGKLDIAVAGNGVGGVSYDVVSILLGNGDGTFQPAVSYQTGGSGTSSYVFMTAGDFNSDGKLDLAVADFGVCGGSKTSCYEATANVLLGNGDGTFQPPVPYAVGSNAFGIISADLNGDGKLDLIVTNICGLSDCDSDGIDIDPGTISVLLGNGDGTFQPAIAFDATAGDRPTSVAAGDFNQDGKIDLAVTNQNLACCDNGSVGILLGNNDGTFQTTTSYSTGALGTDSVVIGDFNGDGIEDVAVGSSCVEDPCLNDSWVSVLLGRGDGSFSASVAYQYEGGGSFGPSSVATGDFNRDGKLDLVATGAGSSGAAGANVFIGNGDGTFQTPVAYNSSGEGPIWLGVADFNGDGKLDVAIANRCADNNFCTNGAINILLGNGDGTFRAPIVDSAVGQLSRFVIGDFNEDGKLDLAMPSFTCAQTCSTSFLVLFGNGDGTFQPPVTLDTGGYLPFSAVTADFNADGKPDLVVANGCGNSACTSNGNVAILLGNGDGTFQSAAPLNISTLGQLSTGDFNGDGKIDLLVMGDSSLELMLGNGDGTFQAPISYFSGGGGYPAVGDFNRDGKPDLVVPSFETVSVLTNIATGFRYATSTTLASSSNPATAGQSITFTATVTGAVSGSPTGTVTFNDGANSLGVAILTGNQATLAAALSAGPHAITTTYSGDSTFLPSTSPTLMQTVNAAAPDFSLASSALAPASVAPGGSSTAIVNVTALNGFSGSVALTCSVTPAPAMAPTCAISPNSISAGTTATLTVNTTGYSATAPAPGGGNSYALLLALFGLVVAGSSLVWQKPQRKCATVFSCALVVMLALLVACGGNQTGGKSNQTPGATYTVTISGTSSTSLQHSTTATVTVQ